MGFNLASDLFVRMKEDVTEGKVTLFFFSQNVVPYFVRLLEGTLRWKSFNRILSRTLKIESSG